MAFTSFCTDSTPTLIRESWRYRRRLAAGETRSHRIRRRLTLLLGLIWLLDAALQFQPFMFTRGFVTQIIEPAASGDPTTVSAPMLWAAHLMLHHIAFFNAIFATTQLLIALGLFLPRTRRLGLAGSVAYALSVWWLGEGLGGIFTGASPLAGLPGGVVLYALIALLLWPRKARAGADTFVPATSGLLGPIGARLSWAALWAGFAYYLLLPANRSGNAVARIFETSASGEPGWLRSLETAVANFAGGDGIILSVLLALASAFIALGIFRTYLMKPTVILGICFAAVIWVAEAFGGIFTGTGTDPNTGPLLVLLAACYWPYRAATNSGPRTNRDKTTSGEPRVLITGNLDLGGGRPAGRDLVPANTGRTSRRTYSAPLQGMAHIALD